MIRGQTDGAIVVRWVTQSVFIRVYPWLVPYSIFLPPIYTDLHGCCAVGLQVFWDGARFHCSETPNMVSRSSAHLSSLATGPGLGTISGSSDIARFVQGGIAKTFRRVRHRRCVHYLTRLIMAGIMRVRYPVTPRFLSVLASL